MILLLSHEFSSHVLVAAIVTLVWCIFSFVFAADKKAVYESVFGKNIHVNERVKNFFKSDFSISFGLFIGFLIIVSIYCFL